MSRGSDRITIRVPKKLLGQIILEIEKHNLSPTVEPWTYSDFFRHAAQELLRKKEAGRKGKAKYKRLEPSDMSLGELIEPISESQENIAPDS